MTVRVKIEGTWRTVADPRLPKVGQKAFGGVFLGSFDNDYYIVAADFKYHVVDPISAPSTGNALNARLLKWQDTTISPGAYTKIGCDDDDDGVFNRQVLDNWIIAKNNDSDTTNNYQLVNFPAFNYLNTMNVNQIETANDWYLPSFEELLFVFRNIKAFNRAGTGSIKTGMNYWTSTEHSANVAHDIPLKSSDRFYKWYFKFGCYDEHYRKYKYEGYSAPHNYFGYNHNITSYKNVAQGVIPIRRIDFSAF